jgi:hypothetical protein
MPYHKSSMGTFETIYKVSSDGLLAPQYADFVNTCVWVFLEIPITCYGGFGMSANMIAMPIACYGHRLGPKITTDRPW